ncbi:MAG: helix-turn-helix domain-containing protein [Elusimicrobia bacterium]|nr:helix-turn-helix domain-containing protein [Elusimicrobiota bacterium]
METLERKLKPFEAPLQGPLLKWLYLRLPPQPISTRKMHADYSKVVSLLLTEKEKGELDAVSRKAINRYLLSIVPFIENYEKNQFPIGASTPEQVLRFLMEQNSLSQYDLAADLGGQPVVSDVLRGKRRLTRDHIERLSARFHVSPAAFYPTA